MLKVYLHVTHFDVTHLFIQEYLLINGSESSSENLHGQAVCGVLIFRMMQKQRKCRDGKVRSRSTKIHARRLNGLPFLYSSFILSRVVSVTWSETHFVCYVWYDAIYRYIESGLFYL